MNNKSIFDKLRSKNENKKYGIDYEYLENELSKLKKEEKENIINVVINKLWATWLFFIWIFSWLIFFYVVFNSLFLWLIDEWFFTIIVPVIFFVIFFIVIINNIFKSLSKKDIKISKNTSNWIEDRIIEFHKTHKDLKKSIKEFDRNYAISFFIFWLILSLFISFYLLSNNIIYNFS